jgi:hypothetical protein
MRIAQKTENASENQRTLSLDQRSDGTAILWIAYPNRPDKDVGWPVKDVEATIKQFDLLTV